VPASDVQPAPSAVSAKSKTNHAALRGLVRCCSRADTSTHQCSFRGTPTFKKDAGCGSWPSTSEGWCADPSQALGWQRLLSGRL
jgi:hypothetical protein